MTPDEAIKDLRGQLEYKECFDDTGAKATQLGIEALELVAELRERESHDILPNLSQYKLPSETER